MGAFLTALGPVAASLLLLAAVPVLWRLSVLARAAIWEGYLPGRVGALPVVRVDASEAPRGWKCSQVLLAPDGSAAFAGLTIGGRFGTEDGAVCTHGGTHAPPSLRCDCGFHAWIERERAVQLLGERLGCNGLVVKALLEVDLLGTILECTEGWRASQQRVLSVAWLPWCSDCGSGGALVAAEALAGEVGVSAERHTVGEVLLPSGRQLRDYLQQRREITRGWAPLRPVCRAHAHKIAHRIGGLVSDPLSLSGALATEVRWLPPLVLDPEVLVANLRRPPLPGPR